VVRSPEGKTEADASFAVTGFTTGLLEPGSRLTGRHDGGAFDVEIIGDPAHDKTSRVTIRLAPRPLAGLPAAAAHPGVALLAALRQPNTLHLAGEYGPPYDGATSLFQEPDAAICVQCAEAVRALEELRPLVRRTLRVPDVHSLSQEAHGQLLAAARATTGTPTAMQFHEYVTKMPFRQATSQFGDLGSVDLDQAPILVSFELEHRLSLGDETLQIPGLTLRISDARLTGWDQEDDEVTVRISVSNQTTAELVHDADAP
jgi:hypothetical protein